VQHIAAPKKGTAMGNIVKPGAAAVPSRRLLPVRGPHECTQEMRRLANLARKMAGDRAVLYHGSRYPTSVLRTGVLFTSEPGLGKISFTRLPEVAAYWALMERRPDEGCGAIFLFDREALRCRYKIEPVHEKWVEVNGRYWHDEAEEEVWTNIANIRRYLVGYISTQEGNYPEKEKQLNKQILKMRRRIRQMSQRCKQLRV
jgi:hypothetical protein